MWRLSSLSFFSCIEQVFYIKSHPYCTIMVPVAIQVLSLICVNFPSFPITRKSNPYVTVTI